MTMIPNLALLFHALAKAALLTGIGPAVLGACLMEKVWSCRREAPAVRVRAHTRLEPEVCPGFFVRQLQRFARTA